MSNAENFTRQIEARMALDAYERAADIYDVVSACAENEGSDPETDYGCMLARSRREMAKLALWALLDNNSPKP